MTNEPLELEQGDPEYLWPTCDRCGANLEFVECQRCHGEGGFDSDYLMELDPLYYEGVDWKDCPECGGESGDYLCPNCDMV